MPGMTKPASPAHHLADARTKAGRSYDDILSSVTRELAGVVPVTKQTVINYHNPDKYPAKPDLFILAALVYTYGLTLSEIGVEVPESLRDLVFRASRWNVELAAHAAA